MNVTITARHTDITEAMREYAERRVRRLVDHFDTLMHLEVILNVEKKRHTAEVIATCRKAGRVTARAEGTDMYPALDQVVDRMMQRLRRHKERLKAHRVHRPEGVEPGEGGAPESS